MKITILIFVIFTSVSLSIYGQNNNILTSETNKFYCKEWLFEFPDTLYIFTSFDSIPKLTRYSVIKKNKKGYYDLLCWTGEIGIETPTQLKDKLKIKFKDDIVSFSLRKLKGHYTYHLTKEQLVLIKRE